MAAAAPAAAPPATAGGSHEVPGTACATAGTGSGGGAGPAVAPATAGADGSAAPEAGAPVAPRPPAAGAAAQVSLSPLLQQPTMKPRRGQWGPAFGSWATQQVPWQQQQQQHQQPYLPAAGGVCCIAPWASDATRTGALYPPSRGAGERGVDDSVAAAAASASTAAAAAVYPDEAPLLCCEKKIRTVRDLGYWMSSSSYSHYVGFLKRLSLAVVDKKAWRVVPPLTDSGARAASGSGGIAASSTAGNREAATARAPSAAGGKNSSSQQSHNSGGSGSPAAQICVPLLLPEEGAFYRVENSSGNCRDSRSRKSSTTADTVCSTASAESEGTPQQQQQQQQRRLSTEGLLTPPAAATASEEMVETALATGNSEAKQRAAALAAAAAQEGVHVSGAVVHLLELLQQLLLWVEDIKPVEQPMRFGNKAFRSWLQRLETCCQWLLTPLIPEVPRPAPAPLLCETIEEDPEREAAEAATSSPPPGVAAGSASAFASAPAVSSSSDPLLPPVPARLAAETLTKAPGGDHSRDGNSSSSSSRDSPGIRDELGDGSSTYAGAAEGNSGGATAASVAGVEEAAAAGAAGTKDAAALRSSSRGSGGNSKLTSRDSTSTEQDRDRSSSSNRSSSATQEEEQKTAGEERRVAKGRSCGEEEEEHAGESFVRRELLKELIDYLCHSFGDARRLDYGTGHEASFALFLLVLFESHVLREGVDDAATVLLVFTQYVEVCHALQRRYSLEPAGSRGAWGLDDFHFLPFLFGSAQLQDQLFISPAQVMEPAVVHEMAAHNLYFSSIEYIMQTKRGAPFSECAPMLYDISGISSWKKIHAGLLRMYEGEVLNKFPIAQHFLFGRYFPLNLLDASGST